MVRLMSKAACRTDSRVDPHIPALRSSLASLVWGLICNSTCFFFFWDLINRKQLLIAPQLLAIAEVPSL